MYKSSICFILFKPAVPGNIGASARAIKTMGFKELRLVDPAADPLHEEARMLAHGSVDILENCKVFRSFGEAVKDIDFLVATTAKRKSAKVDYVPSYELGKVLSEKLPLTNKIGIVFGTEESGLPNSVLQKCNMAVSIPMAQPYPSLNLSQSVMILAYELSMLKETASGEEAENQAINTWHQLEERTSIILEDCGINPGTPLYHRIIERMSLMKAADARLAHSISSKIMDLINYRKSL